MSAVVTKDFVSKLLQVRAGNFDNDHLRNLVIAKRLGKNRTSRNIEKYFEEIEFGEELKEVPKEYIADVLSFCGYISETSKRSFRIKGTKLDTGETTEKVIPYVHRWTKIYKQSLLAKLYQLEDEIGSTITDVSMITLTTHQRGISPDVALMKLLESYNKLFKCMRKAFGTIDYFYILEPHKTGYAHMHILYCKTLSEADKLRVRTLWSEKYEAASFDYGITFSDPKASSNGYFESGSVSRVRGYLMKYISKSVYSDVEYPESYKGTAGVFTMTKYELLFNALLKKHKIRLWNCSRHFSSIMKRLNDKKDDNWRCDEVSQYYKDELINVIWSRESGLRPDVVKVWNYVLSVPLLTRYDVKRADAGKIKIEDHPDRVHRYAIFEPVWVPVASL